MSVWGNPVMMGGSGGGGGSSGNAWVGSSVPGASLGENGQYYFQVLPGTMATTFDPNSNATVAIGGWEFTANTAITVIGARAKVRSSSYNGTVKLADSSGNVLAETGISLVAGEWVIVEFETPVSLTAGQNYIIALYGNAQTLVYTRSATTIGSISYVRGRYGGLPGTQESNVRYGVDIMVQSDPPHLIHAQYYKSSGAWTQV